MDNKKEVLLLKFGEVILKGLNRSYFEGIMVRDAAERLKKIGRYEIDNAQSVLYVLPQDDEAFANIDKALEESAKIFGIACVCRALCVEKNMDAILKGVAEYSKPCLENAKTFKIESRRSDKAFPLKSPEISAECGGAVLDANPHIKVDVNNPDVTIRVEIRAKYAYIQCGSVPGAGGMPAGSAGKGLLLLSGGIDSPVAGYMCAKRGVTIDALHFESIPYTSERAREKVIELAETMQDYCGKIKLTVISVTEIQEQIKMNCREEYFTLILRRFMMRIAQKIAFFHKCRCIITGESLGQVASQTMGALNVTNSVVTDLPVFRPLIALDKEDIVKIARKIGTFDVSIEPYEDCCTVFTPRHPVTNPVLENVVAEEEKLDIASLVDRAIESRQNMEVKKL